MTVLFFFAFLEGIFHFISVPGASDFIERCVIEQGLELKKNPGEYRIFLFGESTMHGHHLFPKSTIKKWVELYLENLLGKEKAGQVTVINFGRLGEDSRFMLESFVETFVYQPDLVVFYTVHNDFIQLEHRQRLLTSLKFQARMAIWFKSFSKQSRFISFMRRLSVRGKMIRNAQKDARRVIEDEFYDETQQKKYDSQKDFLVPGSSDFKRVYENWSSNITAIIGETSQRDVKAVFYNGVSRRQNFPPFLSVHEESLSKEVIEKWQEIIEKAESNLQKGNSEEAKRLFSEALALDTNYAKTYYQLAEAHERLGNYDQAYELYVLADDHDYFPVRAPSAVNQFYAQLAQKSSLGAYILDVDRVFREYSPHGLVGEELILDQIHPTLEGQALMAKELVKLIYEKEMICPKSEWQWDQLQDGEVLSQKLELDQEFEFKVFLSSANYVGSYHQKAVEFLMKALQIKPNSIAARSHLAWRYWQLQEKGKSIELYQKLFEEAPGQINAFLARHPEFQEEIERGSRNE
jgi:tetratricopeptide (TPR) repeat protein